MRRCTNLAAATLSLALAGCGLEQPRAGMEYEPSPQGSFGSALPDIPGPTPGLASPEPQGDASKSGRNAPVRVGCR